MQALAATGARTGVTAIEARKQVLGSIDFTSTIQRITIGRERDGRAAVSGTDAQAVLAAYCGDFVMPAQRR